MKTGSSMARWLLRNRFVLGLVLVAAFLRLLSVVLVPTSQQSDMLDYVRIARDLLDGDGLPIYPRWPIGYPLFLVPFYGIGRFFGDGVLGVKLANVGFGALAVYLVYRLGAALFSRQVGRLAAMVLALYPTHILLANLAYTENLYILLSLLFLWLALFTRPNWFLLGLMAGFTVLVRAQFALIPLLLGLTYALEGRERRETGRRLLLLYMGIALVTVPYGVRNRIVYGQFVLSSANGPATFLDGNNESAARHRVYGVPGFYNIDNYHYSENTLAANALSTRLAVDFIVRNPDDWLVLLLVKLKQLYMDEWHIPWRGFKDLREPPTTLIEATEQIKHLMNFYYRVVIIVFLGLVAAYFARVRAARRIFLQGNVLLGFILIHTAVHLVTVARIPRYHLVFLPEVILFVAAFLIYLFDRDRFLATLRERLGGKEERLRALVPRWPWRRIALASGVVVAAGLFGTIHAARAIRADHRVKREQISFLTAGVRYFGPETRHTFAGPIAKRFAFATNTYVLPGEGGMAFEEAVEPGTHKLFFEGRSEESPSPGRWIRVRFWDSAAAEGDPITEECFPLEEQMEPYVVLFQADRPMRLRVVIDFAPHAPEDEDSAAGSFWIRNLSLHKVLFT